MQTLLSSSHDACAVLIVALHWDVSETVEVMPWAMPSGLLVFLIDVSLTVWSLVSAIARGSAVVSVQAFETAVTERSLSNPLAM